MKRALAVVFSLAFALAARAATVESTVVLTVGADELWWGAEVAEAGQMPFDAKSEYAADLAATQHGGPAAPLLLSTQGRWVWCEAPFKYTFHAGTLTVESADPAVAVQYGSAGTTLRDAFRHCSRQFFPASGERPHSHFFIRPVLNFRAEFGERLDAAGVADYISNAVYRISAPGIVMFDDCWHTETYGPWRFDPERFPRPEQMMGQLKAQGYLPIFGVTPFVTMDARDYRELESRRALWADAELDPLAVRWWKGKSAILDPTCPAAGEWFALRLRHLREDYGAAGFFLDGAAIEHLPAAGRPQDAGLSRFAALERLGELVPDSPLTVRSAAWKRGGKAAVYSLRDPQGRLRSLRTYIRQAIVAGQLGYPFFSLELAGGELPRGEVSAAQLRKFEQSFSVLAFMPVLQLSVDWGRLYPSPQAMDAVCGPIAIHNYHWQRLVAWADEAAKTGVPIVRSMDFQYPGRGYERLLDQFMVGDAILAAPLLEAGAKTREVVLPPGRWMSDDGFEFLGPQTLVATNSMNRVIHYFRLP